MGNEILLRRLVIKSFHIDKVLFGDMNSIENRTLTISKETVNLILENEETIDSININLISPEDHNMWVNSIMDIIPISTKVLGQLGEGITHTLTGVYVMLTGMSKDGFQMAEFGSSEGILKENMVLGRAGTPGNTDFIINFDVIFKSGYPFDRNLPLVAHRSCDKFMQELREILKNIDGRGAAEVNEYYDKIRPGKKKVVIVKQIAGQGAMYDNQLFPKEPSGFVGGRSIIDMANVPIIVTPNEYRDGVLRAMT